MLMDHDQLATAHYRLLCPGSDHAMDIAHCKVKVDILLVQSLTAKQDFCSKRCMRCRRGGFLTPQPGAAL